jgi:hypothetical protein
LPANGLGGSRATSLLVAHFALQNTASNSAEKKNRPREGVAEGGFGGNSATPERIQKADCVEAQTNLYVLAPPTQCAHKNPLANASGSLNQINKFL